MGLTLQTHSKYKIALTYLLRREKELQILSRLYYMLLLQIGRTPHSQGTQFMKITVR